MALIERIARLEQQLANARKEALEEAARVLCYNCRSGLYPTPARGVTDPETWWHRTDWNGWSGCDAAKIRDLINCAAISEAESLGK